MRQFVFVAVGLRCRAPRQFGPDVEAGEKSFRMCAPCHNIGPDATNKVGPELNGLNGRKSGSVEGFNYSDANKASGITWNEAVFIGIHQGSARQGTGYQDDLRRHQEREGTERPVVRIVSQSSTRTAPSRSNLHKERLSLRRSPDVKQALAFLNRAVPPSTLRDGGASSFFRGGARRGAMYAFHFTGVTANGVPFAELTQPVTVSLLGSFS